MLRTISSLQMLGVWRAPRPNRAEASGKGYG